MKQFLYSTDLVVDEGSSKEDAHFAGEKIFGVFDGAGSLKNKFKSADGKSSGLIAAEIVASAFASTDGSLKDIALRANQSIKEEMVKNGVDVKDKLNLWGTTAAVIKMHPDKFEWAQISDAMILIIYDDGSFKTLVTDYDHDEGIMIKWKALADKKQENIRQLIEPEVQKLRNTSNIKYGVLNGETEAGAFLKTGNEKLDNVKHILLFTDGLFIPKSNPTAPDDWSTLVKLFLEGGLKNVVSYVRGLQKDDPQCWKYPRYKMHDDITAIAISRTN